MWQERVLDLIAAVLGTVVIAVGIPWELVFTLSTPGGGDNPAHPVLMRAVGDALLTHGKVVHYSYAFWSGFEAFQFYFPLPYLVGGIASALFPWQVVFKIIPLLSILALPCAFFGMVRLSGCSRLTGALASLLAVPFLYTSAHVMWGGNVASTLAGMIGNSWAFVFFSFAIGALLRARKKYSSSPFAILMIACAALSHFYALLMIAVSFVIWAVEDGILLCTKRIHFTRMIPFYLTGFVVVALLAWWLFPLIAYTGMSTNFGGNWDVKIFETITFEEKILFGCALVITLLSLLIRQGKDAELRWVYLFGGVYIALYYLSGLLHHTAFINIRLWPTMYFSLYLLTFFALDRLGKILPQWCVVSVVIGAYWLFPPDSSLQNMKAWMEWNYRGIEAKPGGQEFFTLVDILNKEKDIGRVSFESSDANNGVLGSVRTFEMLPLFTGRGIPEGGIVNSATFPGTGYTLQCESSSTCAGWPNGSLMPVRDFSRAARTMKALGVRYHIAQNEENQRGIEESGAFTLLWKGRFFALYKTKEEARLVEVYETELPVLSSAHPHALVLNLPRFDALKQAGYVIDSPLNQERHDSARQVAIPALFNFLTSEWYAHHRSADRGWEDRLFRMSPRYLNGFFLGRDRRATLEELVQRSPEFILSDRGFSTDLLLSNIATVGTIAYLPLVREEPGEVELRIYGRGYTLHESDRTLAFDQPIKVQFVEREFLGSRAPFAVIRFEQIPGEPYQEADVQTEDPLVRPGFPGGAIRGLPQPITDTCTPNVEERFHSIILTTECPGKPHLIKYSYYPKWQSSVPISLGPRGYMVLTPTEKRTILRHEDQAIDLWSTRLSWLGMILLFFLSAHALRARGDSTHV